MVRERLQRADVEAGFLLDGFPRNTAQADVLQDMLSEHGMKLDAVIQLDVSEDELVERLMARGRTDDTEDVRSEEHTSELQSRFDIVCRLLLEETSESG